ncbi:MAG: bifunctional adenosylcobinamide kinase/adenosylcobinamide-phosphate guanylyltransferase [Kurthia sp.]|nr:bifunctional adenosylcobinamide kinase/adenosylcobinamide-phosphate guanylyltransferase [Candidatus Kurthia equi]
MVRAQWSFITGGVRSGKSHFAEQQILKIAQQQKRQPIYIASGVAFDEEMKQRITKHRQDRAEENWQTIEQPINIACAFEKIPENAVVLWDCVTTWLTNELYDLDEEKKSLWKNPQAFQQKIAQAKQALLHLHSKGIPIIIVSNELLDEPSYTSEEVEFYRQQLGDFHQWLVKQCDQAIEMDYGAPYFWKGGDENK